ncbi:MAG: GPR endopeptidase [Firmicutes bacterium]|nr:GPR endopeptidase [Bacillota bacterium]
MTEIPFRSDLANEAREFIQSRRRGDIPGLEVEEYRTEECRVTRVRVVTQEASRIIAKPPGQYVTIEAPGLVKRCRDIQEEVAQVFVRELTRLMPLDDDAEVFVAGLGNWQATPDSLGPRVVGQLLITRHLREYVPADLRGGLRSVAAMAPGVMGLTGIETGEILWAITERIKPDVVIAIDALAARSAERILTTIQLADTGIHPGSGVGNKRQAITRETLGIPVIAVGVPTVVHASTIAYDTIELLVDKFRGRTRFYDIVSEMDAEDKRSLIDEVLASSVGDLMVTPKEIDVLILEMSKVLAGALNAALHPRIDLDEHDITDYLQ